MARSRFIRDISGTGSAKYGGRWNPKGNYVLYTSATPALAMLEWLAHARDREMDEIYCMATLLVPDGPIRHFAPHELPSGWHTYPPAHYLQQWGAEVLASGQWLGMELPSVLLPLDYNVILHVHHPLYKELIIEDVVEIYPDKRLLSTQ